MVYPARFQPAQRPALPIFYVLDTSGSMRGNAIGVLNRAMQSTVDALKQVSAHNSDALVKIAVLEFNTTVRWLQPAGPEDLEHFRWDDLAAGGMTYVGAALDELDSKLSRESFLASASGSFLPIIIFMTDGFANDDYNAALQRIRQNGWFSKATRIGFAIGKDADTQMISRLTGDSEAVIRTDDLGLFATMLRQVSVTSSMIVSKPSTDSDTRTGSEAVRRAFVVTGLDQDEYTPTTRYQETRVPSQPKRDRTVLVSPGEFDAIPRDF